MRADSVLRSSSRFDILPKDATRPSGPDEWTAVPSTNGTYALFEFTGALPRAKLYASWQVNTNDQATLARLASASFDPEQTVLVANLNSQSPTLSPHPSTNSVEFTSYAPKQIVLRAKAAASSVLLLNDKYDPNWKVWVDGKPETLQRCNYLMRGVLVPAGEHRVEFRYTPPVTGLYASLAAWGVGLMMLGCLWFLRPADP